MSELVIRRATDRDEAALLRLAERLCTFELPAWRTARQITDADGRDMLKAVRAASQADDEEVFLAERGGQEAGCLHILATTDFFDQRHAHISVIATSAAAEGSGVGHALMAHAEDWARSRRLSLLTLNVFATNARARRFYEREGMHVEFLKYAKPVSTGQP
ncbi:MAG TPA: GNAT family N-acetyltransferase [Vicinamibacterales bacterium]|nr:GNAT family N-acetyltransferase [Vicinamibacterales bacterium]